MVRTIRVPLLVDLLVAEEPDAIQALAAEARLDRGVPARAPLVNRMIAHRVADVLQVEGRPLPSVAPRDAPGRVAARDALETRLDARRIDQAHLDALAAYVVGRGDRPVGPLVQETIGRLFVAEFRATDETWQAARLLDQAARTLNPIRRLVWAFTGRVNDARRLLARRFAGDPAALHAVAIAVHTLVASFQRMRGLAARSGGVPRHPPAEAASICLAAPPRVLRYATAPGANAHATFRAGTLVLLGLEAARARTLAHDVAFLTATWSRCPAHAWVPALLEAVWQRAAETAQP
ncbi:hypothetical protein [Elioraea tepidiphila]|jgi:hypothetical protein|uniref:hypothetical protein n=1 Tax=Elioraea tepidiphila TaxID=457934 RepID=UPI002FDB089B